MQSTFDGERHDSFAIEGLILGFDCRAWRFMWQCICKCVRLGALSASRAESFAADCLWLGGLSDIQSAEIFAKLGVCCNISLRGTVALGNFKHMR